VTVILKVGPEQRPAPVRGVTVNSTFRGASVLFDNVGLKEFLGVATVAAPDIPEGTKVGTQV